MDSSSSSSSRCSDSVWWGSLLVVVVGTSSTALTSLWWMTGGGIPSKRRFTRHDDYLQTLSTSSSSSPVLLPKSMRDFEVSFFAAASGQSLYRGWNIVKGWIYRQRVSPSAFVISSHVASDGTTYRQCRDFLERRIRLVPRILRGLNVQHRRRANPTINKDTDDDDDQALVSMVPGNVDTSMTLFADYQPVTNYQPTIITKNGTNFMVVPRPTQLDIPVLVAPTSHHAMVTPRGEMDTARACDRRQWVPPPEPSSASNWNTAPPPVSVTAGYCYNYLLGDMPFRQVVNAASGGTTTTTAHNNHNNLSPDSNHMWLHLYLDKPKHMLQRILELVEQYAVDRYLQHHHHPPQKKEDDDEVVKVSSCFSAIVVTADHPHDRVQRSIGDLFRQIMVDHCWAFWWHILQNLHRPLYGNQGEIGGEGRSMAELIPIMLLGWKGTHIGNNTNNTSKKKKKKKKEEEEEEDTVIDEDFDSMAMDWDRIVWLKSQTNLPVVVKGILSPQDAVKAIECGVDGIIVSNHGGRQMDGSIPAIEALPIIAKAVNGRIPIWVDTHIRTSSDIVKAMCLGASGGVLVGRPPLWALTVGTLQDGNGQAALQRMWKHLQQDLEADLRSLGAVCLSDLGPDYLWPSDYQQCLS